MKNGVFLIKKFGFSRPLVRFWWPFTSRRKIKYTLLLPAHNPILRLMIKQEHKRLCHGDPQTVLSSFRQRFGPLNELRETKLDQRLHPVFSVQSIEYEFSKCLKLRLLSQNETEWKFISPRFPHWKILREAGIKIAQYHLNRLVGSQQLTYDELSTVLCKIGGIMNFRPYISNEPRDWAFGQFLIDTNLTAFPDKQLIDVPENTLNF